MNNMSLEKELGFKVTLRTTILDEEYGITPEIHKLLEEAHEETRANKQGIVKKLVKLIEMYPSVPQFKNYLLLAYVNNNQENKAWELNNKILKEHPEYLFGKLNLANQYIVKDKYEKIPEILGEDFDLKKIYPNRKEYHQLEFLSFNLIAVKYFLYAGNYNEAEKRLEIMKRVDDEDDKTEQAELLIMKNNLKIGLDRFKLEKENLLFVESREYDKSVQTTRKPQFNYKQIEQLYHKDFWIDVSIIKEILSLPGEIVIKDLENVILDSIYRFEYFREKAEENGWDEKEFNFSVHALLLLGELNAKESLSIVLECLRQGEEFLEFWFSDFLVDVFYEPLYKLGNENLYALKQFILEPNLYTYARSIVSEVVAQIALQEPERRNEITAWYKEIIDYFLANIDDEKIIDSEVIAFIICDITHFSGRELIEDIKRLYTTGLVSEGICGRQDEIIRDIMFPKYNHKREVLDIYKRYDDMQKSISRINKEYEEEEFDEDEQFAYMPVGEDYLMPYKAPPKIGRNDPCPCGSGKKYKKCCMNKK